MTRLFVKHWETYLDLVVKADLNHRLYEGEDVKETVAVGRSFVFVDPDMPLGFCGDDVHFKLIRTIY